MAKNKKSNIEVREVNKKLLVMVAIFSCILLIISSYAWLSASLDVKIKFFNLVVSTDNGLFISLDGINFSDSVEISSDSLIKDLKEIYPNNTNQWAAGGLWPVSTNGLISSDTDKLEIYQGTISKFRLKTRGRKFLNTLLISKEKEPNAANAYIAFDIFLKNVSGSPNSDNLFLDDGTIITFDEEVEDDVKESMSNILNSMRMGIVTIGSVSSKSDIDTIQNIECNGNCNAIIYEPNKTKHSEESILKAQEYGMTLVDGEYFPTYAVIAEGDYLEHTNGQEGTGIPLDTEHFALQNTISNEDFIYPIYQIPNGITKLRIYVWIEGQDVDSLETNSKGAAIYIGLDFEKDLAGYE